MAKKKELEDRELQKLANSMRTNLWYNAKNKESCAKALFYINRLSEVTGFTKVGMICALIIAGVSYEPMVKERLPQLEKEWESSEERRRFVGKKRMKKSQI